MNSIPSPHPGQRQFLLGFIVGLVAFLAVIRAGYLAVQANRQAMDDLVWQAQMLAQTVSPDHLEHLAGASGDANTPVYQRLKHQFETLKAVYPHCRSVALVGHRSDGRFFFQIDSESPASPEAMAPGRTIERPPEHYRRAFEADTTTVGGRLPIFRGSEVSVAAPIRHPATGRPMALLWVVTDSAALRGQVILMMLPPLLAGGVIIGALLAGVFLTQRRALLAGPPRWMGYLEPACVAVAGIAMTLAFSWTSRHIEERNRNLAFRYLAISKTAAFTEGLLNLRDDALAGLASYIQSSRELTPQGFEAYTRYLTRTRRVQGWKWVPSVPVEEKEQVERQMRAEGKPGFTIWQKDPLGHPVPAVGPRVLYPVLYAAPAVGNERAEGFDLGSEPLRRSALEEAARSGLPTATDPVDLMQENGQHRGMLVFQPVFGGGEPPRLRGFALAVLRLDTMLQSGPSDAAASLELSLFRQGNRLERIAGQAPDASLHPCCECILPFMVFGKPMIVTAHPGLDFELTHPHQSGWLPLTSGLLITGILAALAQTVARRREKLNRLVAERTTALAASEARHRAVFEKNRSIELLIDPETGGIVDANPSACAFYGYSREEMRNLNISAINILSPDEIQAEMERARTLQFSGFHFRHRLASGEIRDVEVHSSPIPEGNRQLLYSIVHDITLRKIAENALVESERNFRIFFNNNPALMTVVSLPERTFMDANHAFLKSIGYSKQELIGKQSHEINLFPDPQAFDEIWRQIEETGRLTDFETDFRHRDGHLRRGLFSSEIIFAQGRKYVLGVGIDITERKQAETERQTTLQRFFTILSNMYSGVVLLTSDGVVEYVNRAYCEQFGLSESPEDLVGLDSSGIFAKIKERFPNADSVIARTQEIIERNQPVRGEEIVVGGNRTFQRDFIPLTIDGKPHGRLWLHNDITERKRVEDSANRQANLIRSLLDSIPDLVFFKDTKGTYLGCNPAFAEFAGRPREEIAGRTDYELFGKEVADVFRLHDGLAITLRETSHNEEWIQYPDGRRRLVETIKTPYLGPDGELIGILGISRDITERRRVEDDLRLAKEEAEAANQAKSDFLANMSHEIRTPMNAILGFAHLVQSDSTITPRQKQHLEVITRSGNFLLSLINDILEMSRIEAGRTTLVPVPFDLHALLGDLERIFLPQIEAKRLKFVSPDLTGIPRRVFGDEKKLRQILFNLLGNAVKFTFAGWVALRVRVEDTEPSRLRLHVEIEDTGIGIAQEELRHLFQRFNQTQSGRRVGGGTGLGLAITRGFVEIMGGKITVSSQIRKGSLFAFHVELQRGDGSETALSSTGLLPRENRLPLRVLLADDREENRTLLRKVLHPAGFEIRDAANGSEAVTLFKIWDPQLILMDLRMPVLDGCEAVRRIRKTLRGTDVKIILNSASAFEEDRRKAIAAGADAFLKKPIQQRELFEVIRTLFHAGFVEETPEPRSPREQIFQAEISGKGLPLDWASAMRDAVEAADYHEVERLIGEIARLDAVRGEQLRLLAEQFDAPRLLRFLDSIQAASEESGPPAP